MLTLTVHRVDFTFKEFGVTDLFHNLKNLQTLALYCKHPNKLIADSSSKIQQQTFEQLQLITTIK